MPTPATSESSTSSPRTMRWYASSTQVRGPRLRYSCPLPEEMTTGGVARRTSTVGAWPKAAAGTAAATDAAVPAFTKSRRLILSLTLPPHTPASSQRRMVSATRPRTLSHTLRKYAFAFASSNFG